MGKCTDLVEHSSQREEIKVAGKGVQSWIHDVSLKTYSSFSVPYLRKYASHCWALVWNGSISRAEPWVEAG